MVKCSLFIAYSVERERGKREAERQRQREKQKNTHRFFSFFLQQPFNLSQALFLEQQQKTPIFITLIPFNQQDRVTQLGSQVLECAQPTRHGDTVSHQQYVCVNNATHVRTGVVPSYLLLFLHIPLRMCTVCTCTCVYSPQSTSISVCCMSSHPHSPCE